MEKDREMGFIESLIETDENIHLFLILLLIAGLFGAYFWLTYNPQSLYARSISKEELQRMSAKEYIAMMQKTSLLVIPKNIAFWPKKEDIPYLLMITESKQYAGSTVGEFDDVNNIQGSFESTVGITAVVLLKAIAEGKFYPYRISQYPPDKDEIIKEAIKIMKAGEPVFSPLTGTPVYYDDELVRLGAPEVIETLKKTDILTLCKKTFEKPMIVKDWPRREDIPYLLSVIESEEKTGVFYWCGFSIIPYGKESTVSDNALRLLNAIKRGEFDMILTPKPENPEDLLTWARAEAAKIYQEKPQTQNTPPP